MKTCSKTAKRTLRARVLRIASAFLCLALLLCLLPAAPAAGEQKVVRVGWYESSFNVTDSTGRRSGYAYEYQMKIAAYTGWKYEYVTGSWSELLQMLIDGELDLMSDVSYTPERAEKMLFPSQPMGTEDYYLFVSAENHEISAPDFSALNGKVVGVNKGSIQADLFTDWAEHHGLECVVTEVTGSEEQSLKMLKDGNLDAYVTVDSFSESQLAEPGRPVPAAKIGSSDFFFAVCKGREDLLGELETALGRVQDENQYYSQQLFRRHLVSAGANAFLTAEEQAWLSKHGPIRVGYQDNYLAFCARDPETGELTGALKDYLENAATCIRNTKIEFKTTAYPTAAAAMDALKKGEVDCVFPANLSAGDGEERGLVITQPLMRTDVFAVIRQADRQIFAGKEHVVVAVNEGNPNYESFLLDNFPGWRTVFYPTTADCLQAVSRGVADCVMISSYRFNNIARQCDRMHLTTTATGAELDYCFAVNAGEPLTYSILSKIAELVPESAVDSALSRYITEDAKQTLGDFLSDNAWVLVGIVGAVMLVILFLMGRSLRAERKAARLISATETDPLTGLYNREYFLQYAQERRREHPDDPMDAVVVNIDRFHAVNALNGREFGDEVLKTLGGEIHAVAEENRGIAGRAEGDRFELWCRHRENYREMYDRLQEKLEEKAPTLGLRMRMGVMKHHPGMDAVQMFDRARTACTMARDNYREHLVVFDAKMQERENYEQKLLNDLHRALNSFEFEVYYQPQYNIQCDPPKMVSAEALVRWNHPELGMIPPGDFIELFERNGKIGEVDRYVWSEAARQVARWRDIYDVTIPVSVNLSRVDVFDPALESALDRLLAYNGLGQGALKLEVTESAYTSNADQVIQVVERLRQKGYVVEMDDFGTGYSSLNMLSAMPVDVLKMDRAFIKKIGESDKDSYLVALILGIARSMKIPVVAEGVETEEQLQLLKKWGCPLVQGFYFSKPLSAGEFEETVIRKMREEGAR